MRKFNLVFAMLFTIFFMSAFTANAYSPKSLDGNYTLAIERIPTYDDFIAATKFGNFIGPTRNILNTLNELNIPEEFRPIEYVRYKGIIYGVVVDVDFPILVVAFNGAGEILNLIEFPI